MLAIVQGRVMNSAIEFFVNGASFSFLFFLPLTFFFSYNYLLRRKRWPDAKMALGV